MRLDPAMSPQNFYAQWVFLWTCAVETMTRSRFESSPTHALRHIEVATFTPQAEKEDFKQFMARIQVAYERTRAELSLLGRSDMLPHEDTLVHLVYSRALRSISTKVQTMLRTTESYSERDLTMGTVVGLYMRAAYRREQNFSGIDSALRSSAPQRPAPQPEPKKPPAGKPTAPPPPAAGTANRTDPAPRGTQRAPGAGAHALPPREPADESCLLPNPTLTGSSVMSPAQRAINRKDPSIRCHNCMDDPAYPKHPPSKCWCLRWDGAPWYHPHEPVA